MWAIIIYILKFARKNDFRKRLITLLTSHFRYFSGYQFINETIAWCLLVSAQSVLRWWLSGTVVLYATAAANGRGD